MKNKLNFVIAILIIIVIILAIIISFLSFKDDYRIELVGEDVTLYVDDEYYEYGYYGYNKDKDVTEEVIVSNNINNKISGEYEVTYSIGEIKKIRKVKVIEKELYFNEDNTLYLWKDSIFEIPTLKEVNNIYPDDIITHHDNIDITTVGEYNLTYEVRNKNDNIRKLNIKVIVKDIKYHYEETKGINQTICTFSFDDELYNYTILPNDMQSIKTNFEYNYDESNEYIFKVYDLNNNYYLIKKQITVEYLKPDVSCIVTLFDNQNTITINANDVSGIKNYKYLYDNNEYLSSSETYSYSDTKRIDKVKVSVKVTNNKNVETISECKVVDNSTKYSESYKWYRYNEFRYYLYIPNTLTKRSDTPLLFYIPGAGELTGRHEDINTHWFGKKIEVGSHYDFIYIGYTKADFNYQSIQSNEMIDLINDVVKQYSLSSDNLFISGYSIGTKYMYRVLDKFPKYFKGAITLDRIGDLPSANFNPQIPIISFSTVNALKKDDEKQFINRLELNYPTSKYYLLNVSHSKVPEYVLDNYEKDIINFIKSK